MVIIQHRRAWSKRQRGKARQIGSGVAVKQLYGSSSSSDRQGNRLANKPHRGRHRLEVGAGTREARRDAGAEPAARQKSRKRVSPQPAQGGMSKRGTAEVEVKREWERD